MTSEAQKRVMKNWIRNHPERSRATTKSYRQRHPEKLAECQKRYRMRKLERLKQDLLNGTGVLHMTEPTFRLIMRALIYSS